MKKIDIDELDRWFFDLPACWQSEITGIPFDEDGASTYDYEVFDDAVTEWWDSLDYEDKLEVYQEGYA